MEVHVGVGAFEHPVLFPVGSAKSQAVAECFQRRHVRGLVAGVGDDERDVDDRLGGQAGHGGRTHVLDHEGAAAESLAYAYGLTVEQRRPLRVRLDEGHRPVESLQRSNGDRDKLILRRQAWLVIRHVPTLLELGVSRQGRRSLSSDVRCSWRPTSDFKVRMVGGSRPPFERTADHGDSRPGGSSPDPRSAAAITPFSGREASSYFVPPL